MWTTTRVLDASDDRRETTSRPRQTRTHTRGDRVDVVARVADARARDRVDVASTSSRAHVFVLGLARGVDAVRVVDATARRRCARGRATRATP